MTAGYYPARELLTVAVWSPLHGREWMVSERQARLVTAIAGGWDGTQAQLAAAVGYSGGGAVYNALRSLEAGGLITRQTIRGRLGRTIVRLRAGVRLLERAAAVISAVRTILTRRSRTEDAPMARDDEYWAPPAKPLEPRSAPVLTSSAYDTRLRMVRAIPSGIVRQLMSRHGHGSAEDLARCDWCAAAVERAWVGE